MVSSQQLLNLKFHSFWYLTLCCLSLKSPQTKPLRQIAKLCNQRWHMTNLIVLQYY